MLGDSLSTAYGLRVEEGWVALLKERLKAQGYGYRVVNASVSGETTGGGLARLPRALELHEPEIVVIELGGNDGLRGLPITATRSNLEQMVRLAQRTGAKVALLGIRLPPNYGPRYNQQFESMFAELARRYRLSWTPFLLEGVALRDRLMQPDGLHPGAEAQPLLLENAWPAIRPLLERERR